MSLICMQISPFVLWSLDGCLTFGYESIQTKTNISKFMQLFTLDTANFPCLRMTCLKKITERSDVDSSPRSGRSSLFSHFHLVKQKICKPGMFNNKTNNSIKMCLIALRWHATELIIENSGDNLSSINKRGE